MTHCFERQLARAMKSCCALALAAFAASANAEDIDIYMSVPPSSDLPNILFVLDNSANWSASLPVPRCLYNNVPAGVPDGPPDNEQSKKIGLEKCALHNVIDALDKRQVTQLRDICESILERIDPDGSRTAAYRRPG